MRFSKAATNCSLSGQFLFACVESCVAVGHFSFTGCLIYLFAYSCFRLVTPFDIHATLLDVLHWPTEQELNTIGDVKSRSLSLFRPIPLSRTCEEASSF